MCLSAHKTCKKPCVEISYNARIEQYSIPPHLDFTNMSGCGEGLGAVRYDFNRVWKLEAVGFRENYPIFFYPLLIL